MHNKRKTLTLILGNQSLKPFDQSEKIILNTSKICLVYRSKKVFIIILGLLWCNGLAFVKYIFFLERIVCLSQFQITEDKRLNLQKTH